MSDSMIYCLTTRDHAYTLERVRKELGRRRFRAVTYDWLFRAGRIPFGTYIFTDVERLDPWEALHAARIYRIIARSGARVLNDPAKVKWRYGLLRALHDQGLNGFDAYRPDEVRLPRRYPVFVRNEADHKVPITPLIHNEAELLETFARLADDGHPMQGLLVIEYAAEPIAPDVFRKYASFCIDGHVFGMHLVHEHSWVVKYGEKSASSDKTRQDELDFIRDNYHREKLERAFTIANIDYGRADFGIVDGEAQIYEINTNPHIGFAGGSTSPLYEQAMAIASGNFFAALDRIDTAPARGRAIDLRDASGNRLQRLARSLYARRPRP